MVDRCVEPNHCGTYAPAYLRDRHPALGKWQETVGRVGSTGTSHWISKPKTKQNSFELTEFQVKQAE